MKVKFVLHDGTVTALFPDIVADSQGNILSYQAIGQHGSASKDLLLECKPATPKQYKDLLLEDLIRDPDYVQKINCVLLPSIFAEIYSLF